MTSTNRRNLDLMSRCAEEVGTTLDKVKVGVRCSGVTAALRLPTACLTCGWGLVFSPVELDRF